MRRGELVRQHFFETVAGLNGEGDIHGHRRHVQPVLQQEPIAIERGFNRRQVSSGQETNGFVPPVWNIRCRERILSPSR